MPVRVLEQIRLDVCYAALPVVFVGDGAGVVYAQLGVSHQCTEDIAALRSLPNIDIVSPADRFELEYCWSYLLRAPHAGYLRFGKADCAEVHAAIPTGEIGNLLEFRRGSADWVIIAVGSMVATATRLSAELGGLAVWSAPVLRPFNRAQLLGIASGLRGIVVLEEHADIGGLGSLIAEVIAETGLCRVARFGTKRFSRVCGDYQYLLEHHGLGEADLLQQIDALISAAC